LDHPQREEASMAFIETVSEKSATGLLQELYAADRRDKGFVANYTQAMSLRPEAIAAWRWLVAAIRGDMSLRRYELITVAAASALRCSY
jgi:hypothetical protein